MIDTARLKNKIIDLAIQGRLTDYYSSDSNVNLLVSKIIHDKNIVIDFENSDTPFQIKPFWAWIKLGWVMDIERGGSPRPIKAYLTNNNEGINWIKIGDVAKNGKYIESTKEKIIPEGEYKSRRVYPGDFLLTNSMSFGRPYISKIEGCVHDGWLILRNVYKLFNIDFLYYLLSSKYAYNQFSKKASGSTVDNLNIDKVADAIIPLPPLDEQKEIVNKIENIIKEIDIIDKHQKKYSSNLEILKSKIIDSGIQGKLTEQLPEDGTAEELLNRVKVLRNSLIKDGKIKIQKSNECENCYESLFEIPSNWEWTNWGNIVNIVSARRVHQSDWKNMGIPFYRAREIAKLAVDGYVDNELFITQGLYEEFTKDRIPRPGDLMVSAVGTLGKTYVVRDDDIFYYKDASVICFENFANINSQYLKYVMESSLTKKQIDNNSGGTTVDTLTMTRMEKYMLPMPPLAEQQRIVEKIDALLAILDA